VRTIAIGGRTTVRATAAAEGGAPVPAAPLTWLSPDTSIVSFDSATGVVRGRRSGIATISVSVPTVRDEAITRMVRIRVVAGGLSVARPRLGLGIGEQQPLEVALLDDARANVGSANSYLAWTIQPDSVLRIDNGNTIVALKPGHARLTGRAPWDSTVTLDVFVVGDLLVIAQNQGQRDLVMKWNNAQASAPLTHDSLVEQQSAWSPDYTRIAFTVRSPAVPGSRVQPGAALFLMQSDGTQRVRVTGDSGTVRFPSFSPAGDKLVFESNASGRAQVWIGDVRGDSIVQLRQVTTANPAVANTAPTISRDGQRVAYVSLRETGPGRPVYGIYQSLLDGSDERLKTAAQSGQRLENPVYAPDGRTLYFLRSEAGRQPGQRVYRVAVDGAPTDSAIAVTPPGLFVTSFAVSADGQSMALATLEQVQGSQQPLQHVMLFQVASGQSQAIDTSSDERPASPTMRPARPAAPPAR
jgi:Tol biopolymer transport system component